MANDAFMTLPAELRYKFNNDPQNFISYLQDPKNDEEAIKYGFKVKRQTEDLANPPSPANPPKKSGKKQPDLPMDEE
jgi:hypothetical protein